MVFIFKVTTILICTSGFTASVLTTILSVIRYIAIKYPFYLIKQKYLVIYLILFASVTFGYTCYIVLPGDECIYNIFQQYVFSLESMMRLNPKIPGSTMEIAACAFPTLHSSIGVTASALTIYELLNNKTPDTPQNSYKDLKKSSFAILLLNLGNTVYIICLMVFIITFDDTYNSTTANNTKRFIVYVFNPIFLSAFNPAVIIWFSSPMKEFIYQKFTNLRNRLCGTVSVVDSVTHPANLTKSTPLNKVTVSV